MNLNADFTKPALLHADEIAWVASPMAGVDRRMLDRIGDEVARATTIVRYAKGSHFSPHVHSGGEEFVVLEGVFQDEHGDFPVGSYVRNPPYSSHTPGAEDGCVIFVKLWQFDAEDRTQIMIQTEKTEPVMAAGRAGVSVTPLYQDAFETVRMENWTAGTKTTLDLPKGGEFLMLNGTCDTDHGAMRTHSWLRLPEGASLTATATSDCKIWMKLDHIPHAKAPTP